MQTATSLFKTTAPASLFNSIVTAAAGKPDIRKFKQQFKGGLGLLRQMNLLAEHDRIRDDVTKTAGELRIAQDDPDVVAALKHIEAEREANQRSSAAAD